MARAKARAIVVYMLRPDCKPGPLESRPPAIKPAGPIINRCKRLAGFKAGRARFATRPGI